MADTTPANNHCIPTRLVRCCRWLTTKFGWLWTTLIGFILSLVSAYLYKAKDDGYTHFPWKIFWQDWYITAIALAIFAILTAFAWLIGKLPIVDSPAKLKRQYLMRKKLQTQDLAIEGIPLIPPKVQLDEIFIPLRLFPRQSDIDQWLTPEYRRTLRDGINCGQVSAEVEPVLVDAERSYERFMKGKKADAIELQELWQRLARQHPTAVIQGYPGMGKSTLLLRLTLSLAHRGLKESDQLEKQISPLLIPIFIRLGSYANWRQKQDQNQQCSIWDYLHFQELKEELGTSATIAWLENCLRQGQCLILFDGLDEVSDSSERYAVQEAIKTFINDICSEASSTTSYNRFLITSRVAGYDQNAFPRATASKDAYAMNILQ